MEESSLVNHPDDDEFVGLILKALLWIWLAQIIVGNSRRLYHHGVMWFSVFRYILVIRDDVPHPREGGEQVAQSIGGSGYNRHETGSGDRTKRGLLGLRSGCRHRRPGISRKGPLTQCLWWCSQTVNVLQAGASGYLLSNIKGENAAGRQQKEKKKKMMIIKGTVRWWGWGGGDLF